MSDRTVRVRYEAIVGDFVANVQRMEASQSTLGKSAESAGKKHDEAWKKMSTAAAIGGGVVLAGVAKAVSSFADFDAAMSAASAATGASGQALDGLRDLAVKMGADTMYSATEAAQAITEMGKAGVSTADIMGGGLKGALDLAAAGQLDVGRAGEIAATAMNQFGLSGKDIPHVADLLAAGAGKALGSVEGLANALKYVGPVAHSMGLSIDETTAVLAEFASKGIVGEQAGTSLRGVLLSLTAASGPAKETMDKFGISVYDASGHTKSYADIAQNLHDKLSGVDEATRNAALGQIFGNAQITAATILYEGGADAVNRWTGEVKDNGYATRQAAALTNNLKGDVERLGGSLDTVFIQTGSSANKSLRSLVQGLTDFVNGVGDVPAPLLLAGSATLGLALVLPKVVSTGREVKTTLDTVRASSLGASTAMRGLGSAGVIAAAAFASVEIQQWVSAAQVATPETDKLAESLVKLSRGGQDAAAFGSLFAGDFSDSAAALDQFGQNANAALNSTWYETFFGLSGDAQSQFSKRVQSIDAALVELVQNGHGADAAKIVDQLTAATQKYGASAVSVRGSFTGYNAALAAAGDTTGKLSGAMTGAIDPALAFTGSLQDQQKAAQAAADALDRARKGFIDYGDTVSGALNANVAYRRALDDANAGLLDQNGQLDRTKQGLDVATAAGQDNITTLTGLAQKAKENALAAYDQTQSTDTLTKSIATSRGEFINLAQRMGATKGQAEYLADQLGVTTDNTDLLKAALQRASQNPASITVNTSSADAKLLATRALLDSLHDRTLTVTTIAQTKNILGNSLSAGLAAANRAEGGPVYGPGTATSDSIPANLSNGEFVVRTAAVQHYGVDLFHQLNAMRFADGGYVARSMAYRPSAASVGGRGGPLIGSVSVTTTDTAAAISAAINRQFGDSLAAAGLTLESVLT